MTVRPPSLTLPHIMGEGLGGGPRLVAREKSRAFDWKSSPLASGPAPLAQTLAIAAEALMNNAG